MATQKTTTTKNTTSTKGATTASASVEKKPKNYGGFKIGYNAKAKELAIVIGVEQGKHIDTTDTGKLVFARNEPRLVEHKTSDGRTLRISIYVDEVPAEVQAAPAKGGKVEISAEDAELFAQFKAFLAAKKG